MTYLTIAGTVKTACTMGAVAIRIAGNGMCMHGQLSWRLGEALQNNEKRPQTLRQWRLAAAQGYPGFSLSGRDSGTLWVPVVR